MGRGNNSIYSLKSFLRLAVGIAFGFSFTYIWMGGVTWKKMSTFPCTQCAEPTTQKPRCLITDPHYSDAECYKVDKAVAETLTREVRVLCWIVTSEEEHERRAKVVKETWGKRCNVLLFTSTKETKRLPTIILDVREGVEFQFGKTKKGFEHIYKHYLDEADWFLKTDDQTYVVVENLRYLLQSHRPDEPIYFGRKFKRFVKQGYMSGAAGYVLSREALKRFIEIGFTDPVKCRPNDGGQEDYELGRCLEGLGVVAGDSSDSLGKGRFFPFDPITLILPGQVTQHEWYFKYTNRSFDEGTDCCSETAISFHYIHPDLMPLMDFFTYRLLPFDSEH